MRNEAAHWRSERNLTSCVSVNGVRIFIDSAAGITVTASNIRNNKTVKSTQSEIINVRVITRTTHNTLQSKFAQRDII